MGLTSSSTGQSASAGDSAIVKRMESDRVVALAGNPNVGKSTLFNELTGMNQHTGNWPGKTVASAQGYYSYNGNGYVMVDLPGTYSLLAHSAEEEVARDFICFGSPDAVVVVCDASRLERNLNLVLQTLEITRRTVVCVNLIDEAERRGITVDADKFAARLGVPVVLTSAREGRGTDELSEAMERVCATPSPPPYRICYSEHTERAIAQLEPSLAAIFGDRLDARPAALMLLDGDESRHAELDRFAGCPVAGNEDVAAAMTEVTAYLERCGSGMDEIRDDIARSVVSEAERICGELSENSAESARSVARDRAIERVLTGKATGFPIMLALLVFVLWLTVRGANYPSAVLQSLFGMLEEQLGRGLEAISCPPFLQGLLVDGAFHVLSWVVAVMLPPMAIFFPLFTLLEDLGYLPRVAFNLDKCFKKCSACGKQALTMCMGFGCNAAGVVGCRIIDSPRERLIAMLTNSFVPCNGRLPLLVTLISLFIAGGGFLSALSLTAVIVLGILMTLAASKLLSVTLLRGLPSSFTLELPPIRRPQIARVLVRSLLDRTLCILGRAAAVALPAGAVIWLLANIPAGETTLLAVIAGTLDPFGRLLGMDGVILTAFILALPANEIVIPLMLMIYSQGGVLVGAAGGMELRQLLVSNGWTAATAVCVMLFSLMHWPCSTTIMTIKKESGSLLWTAVAVLLPTLFGMLCCFIVAALARLAGV